MIPVDRLQGADPKIRTYIIPAVRGVRYLKLKYDYLRHQLCIYIVLILLFPLYFRNPAKGFASLQGCLMRECFKNNEIELA
jgi:hypothetical protein